MSLASRRALYGKLSGDTTLTNMLATPPGEPGSLAAQYSKAIWYEIAQEGATFPYVILQQQAGTPRYALTTNGAAPAFDNEVWTIKGVDKSTSGDVADNIAVRIDALLTDGTISISGKTQLYLRRDTDLPPYAEVRDGVVYRHSGALFRLIYTT